MQKGIYKQINLEVKDFKIILKALKALKCDELNKSTKSLTSGTIRDAELKKYKIKEVCDKYDPLIQRIKEKTI